MQPLLQSGTYMMGIQKRIFDVLKDGRPHSRQELHACLYDDLAPMSNIQPHISRLRNELERSGLTIVCIAPKLHYQLVRKIAS